MQNAHEASQFCKTSKLQEEALMLSERKLNDTRETPGIVNAF